MAKEIRADDQIKKKAKREAKERDLGRRQAELPNARFGVIPRFENLGLVLDDLEERDAEGIGVRFVEAPAHRRTSGDGSIVGLRHGG